jgi:hypothetical protein
VPFWSCFTKESPYSLALVTVFSPIRLQEQVLDALEIKKPGVTGLSLVAGVGLSKGPKYLIINYRFVSTFAVFYHFVSKLRRWIPLSIWYSWHHLKYYFFVSTSNIPRPMICQILFNWKDKISTGLLLICSKPKRSLFDIYLIYFSSFSHICQKQIG